MLELVENLFGMLDPSRFGFVPCSLCRNLVEEAIRRQSSTHARRRRVLEHLQDLQDILGMFILFVSFRKREWVTVSWKLRVLWCSS